MFCLFYPFHFVVSNSNLLMLLFCQIVLLFRYILVSFQRVYSDNFLKIRKKRTFFSSVLPFLSLCYTLYKNNCWFYHMIQAAGEPISKCKKGIISNIPSCKYKFNNILLLDDMILANFAVHYHKFYSYKLAFQLVVLYSKTAIVVCSVYIYIYMYNFLLC